MASVNLTQQQYQHFVDSMAAMEARVTALQTHAEAQQEQLRIAEGVISQLQAAAAGQTSQATPQQRPASPKSVTDGGIFKALVKYSGEPAEHHDWSFSAKRVLAKADERFTGLVQWISGQFGEISEEEVYQYRVASRITQSDMDWLNSELYELLAAKSTGVALAAIKSLEDTEINGIVGWQRLEREARGFQRQRASVLTELVTHPPRVAKISELQQAFYRWETNLKEFQRGRTSELDDDVKSNALRHMMPKEILDAVDLQTQYRTFSEIRDYMLQQARQRADVYVGDVCHSAKKHSVTSSRASASAPSSASAAVPMDVSSVLAKLIENGVDANIVAQVSQVVAKVTSDEPGDSENDHEYAHCQHEQEYNGEELYAVKGKGKGKGGGFQGTCFNCGMKGHKADRCWQKGKGKGDKGGGKIGSKGKGGFKGKGDGKNGGKGWYNYNSGWNNNGANHYSNVWGSGA